MLPPDPVIFPLNHTKVHCMTIAAFLTLVIGNTEQPVACDEAERREQADPFNRIIFLNCTGTGASTI